MTLTLPTKEVKASQSEPQLMVIVGTKKIGKTSNCLQLPNSLLIDLENGSSLFDGVYINLVKELQREKAEGNNTGLGTLYLDLAKQINEANIQKGSPLYDFIIIDNLSVLAKLSSPLATANYKKSLIGKGFRGTDVTAELPKGAGWHWYKQAFLSLLEPYKSLAGTCVILLGHLKLTEMNRNSREFFISDMEVPGSTKHELLKDCDAQGKLSRSKKTTENGRLQNVLSFRSDEEGDVVGCRIPYLANQELVLSDFDPETYEVTTYWERVFPSIMKKPEATPE